MSNVFIPKKIRVGFQKRDDTFTGKLAYVIYYDEANKIRKEKSWLGWCSKDIPAIELDNTPRSGFVLNKGVRRYGSYFGNGRSMVRVFHPDGFEFEITVTNLMGVLAHSDVSRRDIVENCILAWEGGELILLPANSEEYLEAVAFTEKQDKKVSARDLVAGRQYHRRKGDEILTYVGFYEWFEFTRDHEEGRIETSGSYWNRRAESLYINKQVSKGKKHVFWDGTHFEIPSVSTLSHEVSADVLDTLPDLVDQFFKTTNSQKIVELEFTPLPAADEIEFHNGSKFFIKEENGYSVGGFDYYFLHSILYCNGVDSRKPNLTMADNRVDFKDGYRTVSSNWNQRVIELPYDQHGHLPADDPFTLKQTDFYKSEKLYAIKGSKKVRDMLVDKGFCQMQYVLANGNRAEVKV